MFGCFTTDRHGVDSIDKVGEDNICFETDYPHTDTTWPFALEEAAKMTAALTEAQRYKVLRGNAIRMLSLDRVLRLSRSESSAVQTAQAEFPGLFGAEALARAPG